MPNISRGSPYLAPLCQLAWSASGWASRMTEDGAVESWGPISIQHTIALDILELSGCLDAPDYERIK